MKKNVKKVTIGGFIMFASFDDECMHKKTFCRRSLAR